MGHGRNAYARILLGGAALLALVHGAAFVAFLLWPKAFYYRSWEWFDDFPFRSSQIPGEWQGPEQGDLSPENLLLYKYARDIRVTSDRLGFRSVPLAAEQYRILVAGDSTIWGCGLSDDETFPYLLANKLGVPVFNGSRTDLSNVMRHPALAKVETIIDGRTEAKIRTRVFQRYGHVSNRFLPLAKNDLSPWQAYINVNPKRYSPVARLPLYAEQAFGDVVAYWNDAADLSFTNWPHQSTPHNLRHAVAAIVERARAMKRAGIRYIFMPIPAKQTLYDPSIDPYTRNYLITLRDALRAQGVETIDLWTPFQAEKERWLFQRYDTHWNPEGTELAARVVAKHLQSVARTPSLAR